MNEEEILNSILTAINNLRADLKENRRRIEKLE